MVYRVGYDEMIGQRFGKLIVLGIERVGMAKIPTLLKCVCDCGKESFPQPNALKKGLVTSCGCGRLEKIVKHGHWSGSKGSKTYEAWSAMKSRCDNPKNKFFSNYGGRGIGYCERWKGFEAFLADMGEAPEGLTLERMDNSKGYSRENCKWATRKEQQNNRRNTRMIEYEGKMWPKQELAVRFNIDHCTLMGRIRRGWPIEKALTYPIDTRKATSKRIKEST